MNAADSAASPYFPDDVIGEEGATTEQQDIRLGEFKVWFAQYAQGVAQSGDPEIKFSNNLSELGYPEALDGASVEVNHTYWQTIDRRVRTKIRSQTGGHVTVDRHKICSMTELSIVHVQPIDHQDPEKRATLNAELAYFCGLNIMANWDDERMADLHISDSFTEAHLTWLENVQLGTAESFPIFSNAATWYLVETLVRERKKGFWKKLCALFKR